MTKHLIIVESPAKTRTLKKFLGSKYDVKASLGHIRDLAKKELGIGKDYEPHYVVMAEKKDVVKDLKAAAKKADTIFLAPDPDREGEAIAWHIAEVLGADAAQIRRVTFNEITKPAVLRALENPRAIDVRKVDAQQARRILDRLMGFKLSPLLWEKVKRGLSAGRVQSVALKMVCERQDEIEAFVPEEYWPIGARLRAAQPPPFEAKLQQIDGKKAVVGNGEDARRIGEELRAGSFRVARVERRERRESPKPPFITSSLQQEAARRFRMAVKYTMGLAQGLYEGREIGDRGQVGLITYMRTDSPRVADEAIVAVRETIAATYGPQTLPEKPNVYRGKKDAQDAHAAIRPTYFDLPPDAVKSFLKPDEHRLYKLIWDRFVASQMLPAIFDVTQVDVENGRYLLRASGQVLKSPGYRSVYEATPEESANGEKDGEKEAAEGSAMLPPLAQGDVLKLEDLLVEQKFTQPKPQYTEATLVKALEENGIGRPSTYASILSTLSEREYATKNEGKFLPTQLGRLVNRMLQGSFNDIINEGYTASLEEDLDRIEDGTLEWRRALKEFDVKFSHDLETAGEKMPSVKREGVDIGESCPQCGAPLRMRFGRYGAFIGCSTHPECTYTRDVVDAPAAAGADTTEGAAGGAEAEEIPPCELCGKPMQMRRSRFGTFLGCTGYPECKNIRKTGPKPAPPKPTGVTCPECGKGEIEEKKSRRGKVFFSCNRYPDCKFAMWNRPVPKPCPSCGAPYLVEKTTKKKGTFLLCEKEGCGYEEEVAAATA